MIGKRAENVLNRALASAVEKKHEFLTLEHVMLALLDEDDVKTTLAHCKADMTKLRSDLEAYLQKEVPLAPENEKGEKENPIATLGVQRLVQRALFQVQSSGKSEIQPVDLLVAVFQAKDSWSLYLLQQQNIDRLDVVSFVSHGGLGVAGEEQLQLDEESKSVGEGRERNGKGHNDVLSQYTLNLNEQAKLGKLDPLVGRKHELDRVIQTLCRRRKNNPLLVGEAGVGKTAIAEGLAQRVVSGEVPSIIKDAVIYTLDIGALLAGTKFRGDFEQRMKRVIQALETKHNKGQFPVLFIDEIHTIVGAGSVNGGTVDAANLLKPMLARGEIRVFGSTTFQEYRNVFAKDQALARRFQKIDVPEPTQDETVQILNGLKTQFEQHHDVVYSLDAIKTAVDLSVKHLTDRFLPDKAIDVIDEVGAKIRIKRAAQEQPTEGTVEVTALDVEEMISQMARIPAKSVTTTQKDRLSSLDKNLKLTIFGQDNAVDKIVSSIRLARSGLRSGDKPIGSFLFAGPTGVGKTELAKQLASHMGVAFVRFDMSEYMEQHTVSRLIGAPPGYVGFEQAGLLTDAAIKNPHSVILLDEIEKAHPSVWNILLQVMDHGFLTDNNGKKADFRNVVVILTSNVGSRDAERRSIGFNDDLGGQSAAMKEVERLFSPEFRNRLDSIVMFNSLDVAMMDQVVGKQLVELEHLLLAKNIEIEFEPAVREWLGKKGYDRKMGARPLARVIQDELKRPLSEEILFGRLENGGNVRVTLKNDKPHFVIEGAAPAGVGKTKQSVES
ncbi:MAG: ATP-dependent Clp protease ATP-binding subunit ClpA [Bdellovibrionales bacterium]|nr:ATP-dependent Clp protease ATP-binding subunit ClpA [Bdellovibrionales bacterium]